MQDSASYDVVFGIFPDSKIHGANMGPIWGRQDPGEPHAGPMNFAICVITGVCLWGIYSDLGRWGYTEY